MNSPRRFLLLSLSVALVAVSCAHGGHDDAPPDRPRSVAPRPGAPTGTATESTARADESVTPEPTAREIDEDRALAFDPGSASPRRRASLRVVEEGKGFLIAARPREAAGRFLRAVQMDPTNGFAYYYLGRARIAAGDEAGAVGVLEKAESLLGPYPEWRERTSRLLASIAERR